MFRSRLRNENELQTCRRPETMRILVFNPSKKKSPKKHETWHGFMTWHIYVVVKKSSSLRQGAHINSQRSPVETNS